MNVAYGSLPSAFCPPQACGACQLSLVSASHRANAHMLPASYSALRKSLANHMDSLGGGRAEIYVAVMCPTNDRKGKH